MNRWIPQLLKNADVELDPSELIVPEPDTRSTLDKAMDSSSTLLERMNSKRVNLEADIERMTEELRQVNVVIEGASAMAGVLQEGRR